MSQPQMASDEIQASASRLRRSLIDAADEQIMPYHVQQCAATLLDVLQRCSRSQRIAIWEAMAGHITALGAAEKPHAA